MTTVLFFARHALVTVLTVATAWAAGRCVLRRWLGPAPMALALAVGLAVLGQALLILGLLGSLRPYPILALVVAIHGLAASDWRDAARDWRRLLGRLLGRLVGRPVGRPKEPTAAIAFGAGVGVLALLLWVLALYPPVAFDETMYHLPFTRAFAESAALPFLPDLRVPVFPVLVEVLAVPLYLCGDDVDTHILSWLATLATAGMLLSLTRLVAERLAGALAAALWLGAPIVVYLSGVGYVEPVLTLLVTGALYAYARSLSSDGRAWRILAGVLAGSAAAVKYHGLFFVAALAIACVSAPGRPLQVRLTRAVNFGLGAFGAALLSYARIVAYTGNPLFPFYPHWFGSSPWAPPGSVAPAAADDLWDFVTLPWRLVFERATTGQMPPHSPWLLAAMPLALYGAWRLPRVRWALLLAVAYGLLAPIDARYLVPAVPAVAFAAALSATLWPKAVSRAVVALSLLGGILYGLYSLGRRGPLPTNAAMREAYLEQWLPLYPAVRFLNERQPSGYSAYGPLAEEMVYCAHGRWLGDWVGLAAYRRILPLLGDRGAFHRELRRLDVEYLVVPLARLAVPPELRRDSRFERIYSDALAEVYALAPGSAGAAPRAPAARAPAATAP